jgi:hypothetical protein
LAAEWVRSYSPCLFRVDIGAAILQ